MQKVLILGLKIKKYLADDIIAAQSVLVHDGDDDGGFSEHVCRNVKGEGLVKDRIQAALNGNCLFLFHTLVFVHEPHLYIGICISENRRIKLLQIFKHECKHTSGTHLDFLLQGYF